MKPEHLASIAELDEDARQRAHGLAREAHLLNLLRSNLPPGIASIRRSFRHEDRAGADLVALLDSGRELPIQVKSSAICAKHFVDRGRRMNVDTRAIAIIVATRFDTDAEILAKANAQIARALAHITR